MRKARISFVILCLAALAGCHPANAGGNQEAIKAAVQRHLNENQHLMLNSFTTHFEKITVKGSTADALVRYQSKNMPKLAVKVNYTLKKSANGWQVVSSSSAGGQMQNPANPHQSAGANPSTGESPYPPAPVPSH